MSGKIKIPAPSRFERAIAYIAPRYAARKWKTRALFTNMSGGYTGASRKKRGLDSWFPGDSDADSAILPHLSELRDRSRDMVRNIPLATGIINTKTTEVVGTGLIHHSRLSRSVLNLSEEAAEALETSIDREWDLFWNTHEVDAARILTGNGIGRQVYRQEKENGDIFILLPRFKRPGSPYTLRLQLIEADRVCNSGNMSDSYNYKDTGYMLAGGILKSERGEPVVYQILKQHPGSSQYSADQSKWVSVPAFGSQSGLKNVIHYFNPTRPGQTRGVPDLAPVMELIKQLGSYISNEALATEIASMFTIFIESETGETDFDFTNLEDETGAKSTDKDIKLAPGMVVGLNKGESVKIADPGRPNTAFDGFVLAICRQIGPAVNLPYEILVKHFTSSYSAARAALLAAWKYYMTERQMLAANFYQVVKEIFMHEAVAMGRIQAPGFFSDPLLRKAYCSSEWTGPSKGMIDEFKEIQASAAKVALGVSTRAKETAELTGGDYEANHKQLVKEKNMRDKDGLGEPSDGTPGNPPKKTEDEEEE
jgi:lambda family phage portal protein